MSFTEINKMYKTKWKKETRVVVNNEHGTIIGTRGMALKVHMDNDRKPRICHPFLNIKVEEVRPELVKKPVVKK